MAEITRNPGHGGKDSGTVNSKTGLQEKDVVLKISNGLGWGFDTMCEGVEHSGTRHSDVFIKID